MSKTSVPLIPLCKSVAVMSVHYPMLGAKIGVLKSAAITGLADLSCYKKLCLFVAPKKERKKQMIRAQSRERRNKWSSQLRLFSHSYFKANLSRSFQIWTSRFFHSANVLRYEAKRGFVTLKFAKRKSWLHSECRHISYQSYN